MNKESLLYQIKIVEENIQRLKILVECDLHNVPDTKVSTYCALKAKVQLENIIIEITEDDKKLIK